MSASSLVTSVPAARTFAGVPATDLKPAARPLDQNQTLDQVRRIVHEFGRHLAARGLAVCADLDEITVSSNGHLHRLRLQPPRTACIAGNLHEDLEVHIHVEDRDWDAVPAELAVIDLSVPRIRGPIGLLTAAWREFLRKHGVRLHPRTWTYRGDWL